MASTGDYLNYILDQLSGLNGISYRAMNVRDFGLTTVVSYISFIVHKNQETQKPRNPQIPGFAAVDDTRLEELT